ncbi:hypothetical protein [Micromonospora sp. WMMD812]|uniref:hypothetical protein n=1 Tax=Micromonospora sp. WMMD812 TaxID=3015152 RepID=UPI00248B2DA7|nr:hypothetical protein [Micromonospora sp. WMMD812]WBB64833.1 hypothetical protein O7603_16495 [Micromonospora sp. WMMD812]
MATQPIQQPSAVSGVLQPPAARPGPASLLRDLHALTRLLAAAPGEPRWREGVEIGLAPVRQGFAEHVAATEGPAGLYAELLAQAPRLDRGVRLLTREHEAIAAALAALQHAAERPGAPAHELRMLAAHLLRALSRHRQRGADLLWLAYETDLGGET